MAYITNYNDVETQEMLDGVTMRVVLSPDQGAPHFNLRVFEVQPGKSTPFHDHWWEHEVFVLAGRGNLRTIERETAIKSGNVILVPGGTTHQFINTGDEVLRFICLVPQKWLEGRAEAEKDKKESFC